MIHLVLKLESPLIISENRSDNILESVDYIPGSVLRGALANAFLKSDYKDNADLFREFFLNEKVRFGNCYLGTENVTVLPATARSCKSFGGFVNPEADPYDPKHGVYDGLILYHAYQERLRYDSEIMSHLKYLDECEQCGAPTEQFTGVFAKAGREERYIKFENQRFVVTRTALDEYTLTAKEGSLFSIEVILPPKPEKAEYFYGKIFVSDFSLESDLKKFIDTAYFSIGGERTYGYGRVKMIETAIIPQQNDIEYRLDNFNSILKKFLPGEESLHFVLTFNSDTILVDRFLRYVSPLNENILRDYYPTSLNFTLVEAHCSTRLVQGWSNIHKLPKENELAIVKGAVFLFKIDREIQKQKLINYLTKIELNGIGERKAEGFGEVIVCHPFHMEVEPK